jgi:hypothetical protein
MRHPPYISFYIYNGGINNSRFSYLCDTGVEEKIRNDITQAFSDLSWPNKDRQEHHPMFIAIKICILIHNY